MVANGALEKMSLGRVLVSVSTPRSEAKNVEFRWSSLLFKLKSW